VKIYFAHSFRRDGVITTLQERDDFQLQTMLRSLARLGVTVIDPACTSIPHSDPTKRFAYCLAEIRSSRALVVDARERLGLGVGAEMMFAHEQGVPVFAILPEGSYYQTRDAKGAVSVHAFVGGLSTRVFPTFEECVLELKELQTQGKK